MRFNLRDRFLENLRMQKTTSNFQSPLKDIVSYYKGRKMESNLKRTVGFRKIPWSGCFEFPPTYPPGLMHNYREIVSTSQVGYPFPTMPMTGIPPSGPFCKECGAKLVLVKTDQETNRKQNLNVYCMNELAHDNKQSLDIKHQHHNRNFQKRCNCLVYQAIMEDEEYTQPCTKKQDFKISKNYKLAQNVVAPNDYPKKCVNRTSTCASCGTNFDPLTKPCGQELVIYIEQEDTKFDLKDTQDKASTHTKKKSMIKSFFKIISPKLRKKTSEESNVEDDDNPKNTKYADCIVSGGNCLYMLGKNIPFCDQSSDSSSTTPKNNPQRSACETLERHNERKTFEENRTWGAYKGRGSKLGFFSESDKNFDQTKHVCKKKKNNMKFLKRQTPDIKRDAKIKVAYECTCKSDNIEDKCSCEDFEIGCKCRDEETRKKSGKTIKFQKKLKSLSGQLNGGVKESKLTKLFPKSLQKYVKPVQIKSPSPTFGKLKNGKILSEAEDTFRCGIFDLKTPARSKSSLVSIAGPATQMDETLNQRRLKKSEFVRTKSILEVTRSKLEPGRPLSRLQDSEDDYSSRVAVRNEAQRKKFKFSNQRENKQKKKYFTPSCTTETPPEPLKTQCFPIKSVKRRKYTIPNVGTNLTSYIEETNSGEYIFYDCQGIGKIPYLKEVSEGEPIFYTINKTKNLDNNEEYSTDSLEEMPVVSSKIIDTNSKIIDTNSKIIDTQDIEFYDEINSSSTEPPRKRSVHFEESCLFCPLDRNIPEQRSEINEKKLDRKTERKIMRPEYSLKKKSKRYEVEMCPHGSSINIVSKLKSDTTLPLQHRRNKTDTNKNVQKMKNNNPNQDYLIYHMSQNLNKNIDKEIEYLTKKQSYPENYERKYDFGEKINLDSAIKALDKLSLDNARYPSKDPQVYTCFCKHFPEEPEVESEKESEESSSVDPICIREEKLENIFPDLESNLIKRDDVDIISLIAHILGLKHPLVQPPDMVLKKDKEAEHKIQEAPKEIETKSIGKINVQRLEKKVERDIKALDIDLEERKNLVGTLKERIIQEKQRLSTEKNRLESRNSELGRIDPVTGEALPKEPKGEKSDGKSNPPIGN